MPPDQRTAPATPAQPAAPTSHERWGSVLIFLIVGAFAVSAFYNNWNDRVHGAIMLIVRDATTGSRSVETFDIGTGMHQQGDAAAQPRTTQSARIFRLSDGSLITLDTAGVVRRDKSGQLSVLIASPRAPLISTPLSVWDEGARIAWVSPADGSLQVFALSQRGTYVPTYVGTDLRSNSLGFTEDGTFIVAAHVGTDTTDLYAIRIATGEVTKVATMYGLISIVPTL